MDERKNIVTGGRACALAVACALLLFIVTPLYAQTSLTTDEQWATINAPDEVDLQVLVDYVGKALDIRFIYGDQLKNQRVQLRPSPIKLPKTKLLELLTSLLRVRDLALIEQTPGFYRIVASEQATRNVTGLQTDYSTATPSSLSMITQVIPVPSGKVAELGQQLSKFLSSSKGSLIAVPQRDLIIVTDYTARIAMIKQLVTLLGSSAAARSAELIDVGAIDESRLADQISKILTETHRAGGAEGPAPSVRGDVVPGKLLVVGKAAEIAEAKRLITQLRPVTTDLHSYTYAPRHLTATRLRELIQQVISAPGTGITPPASMYADEDRGRLFVTAEGPTHQAIETLLTAEDTAMPQARRPLKVYRLQHRRADELLGTLTQLLGDVELSNVETNQPTTGGARSNDRKNNRYSAQLPPSPPATNDAIQTPRSAQLRVQGPDYVLTSDEHTNAILAIGFPAFHTQLRSLLDDLDRRRPQVLIEMMLVAITESDSLDLGVELQALDLGDGFDFQLFSSFGLSQVDAATGQRVLTPGVGANGVLLGPDEVPIIMRALATHAQAKVISTPKLLVSDNAQATLRNVDEAPFTSVNASDTVATTSFAGFESAGTTLTVTPHIAEGGHLTLEYELSFSNFTGASSQASVPPPRTTNSFSSVVEVPDGHTVITGGLVVENSSDSTSEVPFFGGIPLLGKLFQSSSSQNTRSRIFAFIRPVVLKDDEFEDLKFITLKDIELAELTSAGAPVGEPQWME